MEDLQSIRVDNLEQEKSLLRINELTIRDMIVYLNSANLCEYDIEVIRRDLIAMALDAQLRGEKFSSVIGGDYKSFCDELMQISDKKPVGKRIWDNLSVGFAVICVMFVLEVLIHVESLSGSAENKFQMFISWGFIISTILILIGVYAIIKVITRNSFKLSGENSRKTVILFSLSFMSVFCLAGLIRYYLDSAIVASVNYIYPLGVLAIALILSKTLGKQK